MEYILSFLNNKTIIDNIYDFYLLFLLFSSILFLTSSFFFIKEFGRKIMFMILTIVMMVFNIVITSNIPGTAKNFEYILNKVYDYDYVYHFVSEDKKYVYYVLKDKDVDIYYFLVNNYDEKEIKKLNEELERMMKLARKDQSDNKRMKVTIKRDGFKSFETKFEMYEIEVDILPPKEFYE